VGVPVVVADFWFLLWNNVVIIIGCTALSLPSPPPSKGGGVLLAWGSCYVGEAVGAAWFIVYVFVKIECLYKVFELGGFRLVDKRC
jgi:hypothetical protein